MTRDDQVCCRNCTYWLEADDEEPSTSGSCQRYPPQFQIAGERVGSVEIWKSTTAFPRTNHDEVCGEFDSAEAA